MREKSNIVGQKTLKDVFQKAVTGKKILRTNGKCCHCHMVSQFLLVESWDAKISWN